MKQKASKLRLIYLPFLIVLVCFISVYTFLNWLLVIKLHLFNPSEMFIELYLPVILGAILVYIVMRPRIELLKVKVKTTWNMLFFVFLMIVLPVFLIQKYLSQVTGKLQVLENIHGITDSKLEKYYRLENFYIDKKHIGIASVFDVVGKSRGLNTKKYVMKLYIVASIKANENDKTDIAWYGIKYTHEEKDGLSNQQKENLYKTFYSKSLDHFYNSDLNDFAYLESVGNNYDLQGFLAAVKNNSDKNTSTIILQPVKESFVQKSDSLHFWIFTVLIAGLLIVYLMVYIPGLDSSKLKKQRS